MSGTLILDSEALSLHLRADRKMAARLTAALREDVRIAITAATIVEADHAGVHRARLDWVLSRLTVVPLSQDLARSASSLLKDADRHGHEHAIDAMVAATALDAEDKPATVLTSDPDDLSALLADHLDRTGPGREAPPSAVRVVSV
ncbi:type II toxin-antitoxin system VapC family toxin [Frankia nepalensis]|uniref:DNA-binding protein n=1 Tax=Frankia nepalensis TaxID=1836974 RepID=A0A937R7W1_9ACTN|nr:DNA-binding protein [Frankia nepalensis]MBL7627318.1 DNA-binding protein [Frankia nepalensis]